MLVSEPQISIWSTTYYCNYYYYIAVIKVSYHVLASLRLDFMFKVCCLYPMVSTRCVMCVATLHTCEFRLLELQEVLHETVTL